MELTENAKKVLEKRYLKTESSGEKEPPEQMLNRVAENIARIEQDVYGKGEERVTEALQNFYELMDKQYFMPNSPTLMNAGRELQQLAACFVLPVEDSMESIFEAIKHAALIHKSGGGTGFSFSRLRPNNDIVLSTGGVASGPVSFMEVFNSATEAVKQGGTRRGANMGILRVDHPDILEFITCKRDNEKINNFNISVAATDAFMQALAQDEEYSLINPKNNQVVKTLPAREVFDKIVEMAWGNGEPGLIFLDRMNEHNPTPHVGEIESTNPCFHPDTLISTANGLERIEDLYHRVGDASFELIVDNRVEANNKAVVGEGSTPINGVKSRLARVFPTGTRQVIEVSLANGQSIKVTPDHRLLTINGWKEARQLEKGEKVLIQSGQGSWPRSDEIGEESALYMGWRTGYHWLAEDDNFKSALKRVPEEVFNASESTVRAYLRGLFSSMASIEKVGDNQQEIQLKGLSFEMLQDVQLLLLNLGIYSEINREDQGEDRVVLIVSNGHLQGFKEKIGPLMVKRKQKKLEQISYLPKSKNKARFQVAVASIRATDEEVTVYDINEPETHTLIAQGIVAHNCGEQPLLPYESCNLGSVNLAKMVTSAGEIDYEKLRKTVRTAVHFLDNVIDANRYPLLEIEKNSKANRKIGLGVMGFGDMLFNLSIPYNSEKALETAELVMHYIDQTSKEKSRELAEEKGAFPNFRGSTYDQRGEPPIRNATTTTIAPTGSISMLCGTSGGIEPLFALAFTRNVMDNDKLIEVNPVFEQALKERECYSRDLMERVANNGSIKNIEDIPEDLKKVFVTSHDIEPEWHLKMQAAFQKYTDNAVSKTVNLPNSATLADVYEIYEQAYYLNCKGITVYRDGSRDRQVMETSKQKASSKGSGSDSEDGSRQVPQMDPEGAIVPRKRPDYTIGRTERIKTGCGNLYITINEDDVGLCEVFASMGKSGGCAASQSEATARLVSMALRSGLKVESIIKELRGIRCPSPAWNKNGGMVLSCPDAIGIVLDRYLMRKQKGEEAQHSNNGIDKLDIMMGACPDCGSPVTHESGCITCFYCGYSKCT